MSVGFSGDERSYSFAGIDDTSASETNEHVCVEILSPCGSRGYCVVRDMGRECIEVAEEVFAQSCFDGSEQAALPGETCGREHKRRGNAEFIQRVADVAQCTGAPGNTPVGERYMGALCALSSQGE